jgi:glycosyltransferase involved in cell wall biosynthesis
MLKKRLLYISDGLTSGGKERQLVEIIKLINRDKFNIGVLTYNENQHYSKFVKENVEFFREINKVESKITPFKKTWKAIIEFKPDVIHTWDSLSSLYAYLPSKINNIFFIDGSIRDAGIEKGWQRILKKSFLKLSDLNIANSLAGLENYNSKGLVVYNAININRFKTSTLKEKNMIMVAGFSDYKDQKTVIDAAAELMANNEIEFLYLIGGGKMLETYKGYVLSNFPNLSNRIVFTGVIENVEEYLTGCKYGILCSTEQFGEGLSNSVLEYLASGLISIVTNIGGSKEIIDNGENGFLIKAGDKDEIIKIISEVNKNDDLADKIITNAKKTIQTKFNHEKNIELLENIYANKLTGK